MVNNPGIVGENCWGYGWAHETKKMSRSDFLWTEVLYSESVPVTLYESHITAQKKKMMKLDILCDITCYASIIFVKLHKSSRIYIPPTWLDFFRGGG